MFAIHFTEDVAKIVVSKSWNLGSLSFTQGVADLIERGQVSAERLLMRHLAGDYGMVSMDRIDHGRTAASRSEGRVFSSVFEVDGEYIKVVTVPTRRTTVMCTLRED